MFTKKLYVFVAILAIVSMACSFSADSNGVSFTTSDTPATAQVVEATAEAPVANDNPAPAAPACREETWLNNAVGATNDVAALISVLDRDFDIAQGGQWSEPGYTVPANSVFWTDLFGNKLPDGVKKIRTQGGWGVYQTSVDYIVPSDNGGGRFMRLCK